MLGVGVSADVEPIISSNIEWCEVQYNISTISSLRSECIDVCDDVTYIQAWDTFGYHEQLSYGHYPSTGWGGHDGLFC